MGLNRFVVVSAAVFTVISGNRVLGQSRELDRPTLLKSTEQTVNVEREGQHYFAFDAAPGEVTLFLAATNVMANFAVLDSNMEVVESENVYSSTAYEEQGMIRISVARQARIVLRVTSTFYPVGGAKVIPKYRFRLGGAVAVGLRWLDGLPKEGILLLKMKDGTAREINLVDVAEVSMK